MPDTGFSEAISHEVSMNDVKNAGKLHAKLFVTRWQTREGKMGFYVPFNSLDHIATR